MAPKRVAIIGAGSAGLPAIRHALLYGLEPVCFEATSDVGGLWCYKEAETPLATVMKSTVINTSKEMTCYSDFPFPADFPNFMQNKHMKQYFRMYAEHYNLLPHIRFGQWVLNVKRADDYKKTGRWTVVFKDSDGTQHEEVFDAVLHATGHHATPYLPPLYEGQEHFKGRIIHSHSYKHPGGYGGKVVVVVGIGNSSMDVTVELSRVVDQVYLSTRRGAYIKNRVDDYGRPYDLVKTRFNAFVESFAPEYFSCRKQQKFQKRFDHGLYGLRPSFKIHQAHGTISDELPNRIICGAVKVKANIKAFGESSVTFEDGSVVEHVDEVIFATGYRFDLPLLEEGTLVPVVDNEVDLYKYIFPLETTDHNTLGLLGEVQVAGSVIPITELQARVFFEQLSGNIRLPSREEMLRDVRQKRDAIAKRFVHSVRHTIQTDYMAYADELADIVGCKPIPSAALALADPKLVYHMLFGPYVPSLFRLQGPHPWKGAREAVLSVEERVKKPFDTRKAATSPADACLCHLDNFAWKALVVLCVALVVYVTMF